MPLPTLTRVGREVSIDSHIRRHLDEEVARWATIIWATLPWLDRWFPNNRAKYGIGSDWADEHGGWVQFGNEWRYVPRKLGECCATLVLKQLEWEGRRLFDFDGMQKMLHFVTDNDLTADHRPDSWRHDLAHTINFLYDIEPDEELVGAWTMQALDIWFAGRDQDSENFTVEHLHALSQAGFAEQVPAPSRAAWRYTWKDWHDVAQAAIAKTQADFRQMERVIKDLPPEHTYVTSRYDGTPLKVAFVTESNRQTGAASRWCDYDVCVQLHPQSSPLAGGLQVYRNRKRRVGTGPVDLQPIAYHLKRLSAWKDRDQLPPEVQDLDQEQWLYPGYAHPFDRCYFFVADETVQEGSAPRGEGVFFKSLTAPGIPVPVTPEEAIGIVIESLDRYQDDPYASLL